MRFVSCWLLTALALVSVGRADSGLPAPAAGSDLLKARWPSFWITGDDAPPADYAVVLLRKTIDLPAKPARFIVHVSADARYRLKVNGQSVCFGPQWSAAPAWRYESVDLAPFLKAGRNVLTARVRSYGDGGPLANMGRRLAFILQGDSAAERVADTGPTWKALRDPATTPFVDDRGELHTYFALGPGERHDGTKSPWDWEQPGFDDRLWPAAHSLDHGTPAGWGAENPTWLSPRSTPLLEEKPERLARVVRASGVAVAPEFVAGHAPFTVPPHTAATILLDQAHLTNAFPQLTVSGGRGAVIRANYAEALLDARKTKGHRDETEGRDLIGVGDEFIADGGARRVFAPDDFRTYRYVQLRIQTADTPLVVEDYWGMFTGYPFVARGNFTSGDDPRLDKIWEVGWRTARLCAFETYMDCPYYEQLQYVGDTRIQALISLYVAGDDRLVRNAIELFDQSRLPEGITQSRYPSASAQLIPTFSLFWIDMVHDYWRLRDDPGFVAARLPGVHAVLDWYERHLDAGTGLLGPLPYWPYVDWVPGEQWPVDPQLGLGGVPPGGRAGGSATITLQLAITLQHAAELCDAVEDHERAAQYSQLSARLKRAVEQSCWDAGRRLFADTPAKKTFSQHTNTFAVLAGAVQGDAARDLIQRVADDPTIAQASSYFRFYLLRAMRTAGLGDRYLSMLGPWHRMIDRGLTTFAEKEDPTRSDCHAWSASPLYEFLATVCGIEPASPGFATVRIEPHLGPLNHAVGHLAHPKGDLAINLKREKQKLTAEITLPEGVTGEFVWQGKTYPLRAGGQTLEVP